MTVWTAGKLLILFTLIATQTILLARHTYFRITDIRVVGLDSYASDKVRSVIQDSMDETFFLFPRSTYFSVSRSHLQELLEQRAAFDSLLIEKKFPHKLIVTAAERQPQMQFEAPNGVADIGDRGDIIRWYPKGEINERAGLLPRLETYDQLVDTKLGSIVVDSDVRTTIIASAKSAGALGAHSLVLARDAGAGEASLILMYSNGLELILRTHASSETQIAKAIVSYKKYPHAKKIDVRFSDKVFVSF